MHDSHREVKTRTTIERYGVSLRRAIKVYWAFLRQHAYIPDGFFIGRLSRWSIHVDHGDAEVMDARRRLVHHLDNSSHFVLRLRNSRDDAKARPEGLVGSLGLQHLRSPEEESCSRNHHEQEEGDRRRQWPANRRREEDGQPPTQ